MRFVGSFAGGLNRPLLGGDTRSGGKSVVSGGEVGNLSALVDKPFEILAVLLDDFVLDVLVLLRALLGSFEFTHQGINGAHLLVKFF